MPSIHPSIRPCTKQRRTQPLCMRSLVLNSLEPKKNNNNFHLPREIATRIVKQKAISSHQRNVRCRWFPVDGKKRREEESKQILPDHDAGSVRCLHTYSGRIKNYHKTHAQAVVDARHNYRPVGQCVLVQSKRNDTPIGRIICCHSARMAHTHTHRGNAQDKSRIQFLIFVWKKAECSFRCAVGVGVRDLSLQLSLTKPNECERKRWMRWGIQVTAMRIESISFFASYAIQGISSQHRTQTNRAHSGQLPGSLTVCDAIMRVCHGEIWIYVSCAFIPFNSSTSLCSIFSIHQDQISFVVVSVFVSALQFFPFSQVEATHRYKWIEKQ